MSVKKEWRQVNQSGLRKPVYTQMNEIEITRTKGKIRSDVDRITTNDGQPYDLHDQLADISNALDAIIPIIAGLGGNISNSAITKFLSRKSEIDSIVIDNLT